VFKELTDKLQSILDPTGDWFIFQDHIVLRIYGFTEPPYIFPSFLRERLLALEFMRQRLYSEKESFLKVKKGFNIKIHYVIGPFVIKSIQALPIIENILERMRFQEASKINYDPKGIIARKRLDNKCPTFRHQEVPGLLEISNSESVIHDQFEMHHDDSLQESQQVSAHKHPMISNIQTLAHKEREPKRTHEETTGMEIDPPTSSKRAKSFVPDKEIVDLENEESINQDIQVRERVLIQEER
jgi:hypothetical protein